MRWITLILLVVLFSGFAFGQERPGERPGVGIDSHGGAVIDPTKNVEDLVRAEQRRQDDLRKAQDELFSAKLEASEKYNNLLAKHNQDLREAAILRIDAENKIRDAAAERLAIAEAKRIDAIRAVDVNAVAVRP